MTVAKVKVRELSKLQRKRRQQAALLLYAEGFSSVEVERKTGIPHSTIIKWAKHAGIVRSLSAGISKGRRKAEKKKHNGLSHEDARLQAIQMWDNGVESINDIAKCLSYSTPLIYEWLADRMDIRNKSRMLLFNVLIEQGYKPVDIAKSLGCSLSTVYTYMKTLPVDLAEKVYVRKHFVIQ